LLCDGRGAVFLRAGIILLVGVLLWAINRLVGGRGDGELRAEGLGGPTGG
jgi:hypothetical protein